jgi:hypothetical protein
VLVPHTGQRPCLPAEISAPGALAASKVFEIDYGATYPKAVAKIVATVR